MTEEQLEKTKIIAEFMNIKTKKGFFEYDGLLTWLCEDLKYNSDWNWQIPVYSKVIQLLKECIKNMDSYDYLYNYYHKIKKDYYKAIYSNDVKDGFRIIIDAIRHYNLNKEAKI